MKKVKKHHFYHKDPERAASGKESGATKETPASSQISENLSFVRRDFTRAVITITIFVVIIILLYIVQTKTNLLGPVLKLFGL